jgi:hypothetical protein
MEVQNLDNRFVPYDSRKCWRLWLTLVCLFCMVQSGMNLDTHSKTSRVMEGNVINTDVSAVGAIVALSLIYMKCAATQNSNCSIIFA